MCQKYDTFYRPKAACCFHVTYSNFFQIFFHKAMAELAQLKVELARALEAQTGSQSEQTNLAQQTSELVRTYTTEIMGRAKGVT